MEGFKALGFDPHTMQSSQPMGGPLSPQDALVHLHKLSSMVSQLLQAFSRYLSPLISLLSVTQTTRHCVSLPVCRFLCLIYFSLLFVFKRLYSMFHINIESHDSLYVKGGRLWWWTLTVLLPDSAFPSNWLLLFLGQQLMVTVLLSKNRLHTSCPTQLATSW